MPKNDEPLSADRWASLVSEEEERIRFYQGEADAAPKGSVHRRMSLKRVSDHVERRKRFKLGLAEAQASAT